MVSCNSGSSFSSHSMSPTNLFLHSSTSWVDDDAGDADAVMVVDLISMTVLLAGCCSAAAAFNLAMRVCSAGLAVVLRLMLERADAATLEGVTSVMACGCVGAGAGG